MTLRDYQIRIVSDFQRAMANHKKIVIASPTGSGKTAIAIHGILPLLPKPVLWVTHRKELAEQVRSYQSDVRVVMIGKASRIATHASVIIDEGHHVCAATYGRLFHDHPRAVFVALTATPYRMDGKGLGDAGFSKIISGPDIYDLTRIGSLSKASVWVPESMTASSWTPQAVSELISQRQYSKAIVFCRTVNDAQLISGFLQILGIHSASVDGKTKKDERQEISKRFKSGEISVLTNHTIFTEGYDTPEVDMVVLNRKTNSRCLWKQMVGRGLRTFPSKQQCTILDLANNGSIHGSIYDEEVFNLDGSVRKTISRCAPEVLGGEIDYEYNSGERLIEWTQERSLALLRGNCLRQRPKSPLLRFATA